MKKPLFILLVMLVCGGALAFASGEVDLVAVHGQDLERVTFPQRHKFEETREMTWENASFQDRKDFLKDWYQDEKLAADDAKQALRDAQQAQRDIEVDQVERERVRREKIRDAEAAERQAQLEELAKKRDFEAKVKARKEHIQDLRRTQNVIGNM